MLMWTCYHFLQMSSDDSSDESDDFFKIVLSGAMLAQIYCDMYLDKNPPRTSTTSGMGWLLETLNTPGECHTQLRMSNENIRGHPWFISGEVWAETILSYEYL